MLIVAGGEYTFHFSTTGNDVLGTMGQIDSLAAHGILDAGFPIVISSHGVDQSSSLGLGNVGLFSISFTYNGTDTDSNSLGNAMQDDLNVGSSFGSMSALTVNFESADGGNTTTGVVNVASSSLPAVGVMVAAVFLLAVAVYSFAGHAAERI